MCAYLIHLIERKHAQLMWATQNSLNLLNKMVISAAESSGWGQGVWGRGVSGEGKSATPLNVVMKEGGGNKRLLDIIAWQVWDP